ncbi:protein translocase subunit SecDF [Neobacillus dielmonensis]|uniref:protein translocase subunit SecDF n=1 Tax=Neobacillus dielmonensis TaxID=1347369 RepID=UPI0005AB5F12|nr:protein translocase subunit SecDF [Neobacillus dielmonensis]
MVKRSRIVAFILLIVLFASSMGATTKNILNNIKLGLDLQGGFEVLYEVQPAKKGQKIDKDVLADTAEALDRRINVLGVSEPVIQIEGNNRIRVQLAGVKDQNEAREILSTQANLTFRDANDKLMMDGADLKQGGAKQTFDENGKPSVSLTLKSADKFKNVTQDILKMAPNNVLVIWLDFEEGKDSFKTEATKQDPKYLSSPTVNQVFNSNTVSIVGNFKAEEAKNLASLLNAGALPVKLHEVYSTSVGAKFGEQALHDTVYAGILGVIVIFLFMIFYYRFPGFIATITLSVFTYLVLLIFDWMNGVLTLPGIAAIILGIGMAVDANIITYERIREELKVGKSLKSAYQAGEKNAFTSILDSNLTTILTAAVLFFYGNSSVKGFATMLIISILMSFLTSVYLARLLLGLFVHSGVLKNKPGWFGVKKSDIRDLSDNVDTLDLPTRFDKLDFAKHRKKFFTISSILLVAGLIILFVMKLNLSIDFSSGTRIEVISDKAVTTEQVQSALEKLDVKTDDIVLSGDKKHAAARMIGVLSKNKIAEVKKELNNEFGHEPNVSTVSPQIGKELAKNAIIALLIASVGIVIYTTIRFEFSMAIAAIVSLLHDAFFMVAFFSLTRLEVDLTFIAAVLTIVGYSINDTIVTFDRMRENMHKKRRLKTVEDIAEVMNVSIRQTLTRSINTVLTVLITTVALIIFGSESIRNFSIALFVGLMVGVYSSVCIAGPLWYVLKARELKKNGPIKTVKEKKKYSDQPQV